jgi:hypothetical protein
MRLGDAIIAATALVHDLPLVTRNVDDFQHIAELEVNNRFAEKEPVLASAQKFLPFPLAPLRPFPYT